MAPNFQSSFIPKEPITQEVFKKKKTSLMGILVVALFISSVVIAIALYVYKGIIGSDIQNAESQLASAEKSLDTNTINELSQFSRKLSAAQAIILKHKVASRFLNDLASSTVSSVQFTSFSYGDLADGKLMVTLQGRATGYASVALQENIFSKDKYFKSLSFSNLALTDKGQVSFDLAIAVDQQISAYSP